MRAIEILGQGSPVADNVRYTRDRPAPSAGPGEALVRTECAALNHLDLWVGRGLPGLDTRFPTVSGSDGAGVVESVGAGVDPAWIGRRVLLNAAIFKTPPGHPDAAAAGEDIHMIGEHSPGTMAEFFVAPVANLLPVGQADPHQATAFGLTHLTAWRMLVTRAAVQPGETVLITGIGGGVALAALGLARHLGCRTIVTSRHASKIDRARALGADAGVVDEGSDWSRAVRSLTGKRGVDVIIDSIGGRVLQSGIRSLARSGRFVTCGCTTAQLGELDLTRVFWNQLSVLGSTMGTMEEFRAVTSLLLRGLVRPVIDTVLPPEQGAEAYRRLESGDQFGKVLVDWTKSPVGS
ncbi:MAG: NADPH:quinone reductase [Planctomycetes bacterium]|nr:NADPH:quinone reductase [Planctomycetota bacterium]